MEEKIKLKKYGIRYVILFVIVLILLTTFTIIFEFDNSGNIIASFFLSAGFIISKFVKDNRRIPTKIEKSQLIWITISTSWIIIILFILSISFFSSESISFDIIKSLFLFGFVLFFTFLMFFTLSFLYGIFAIRCLQYYEKNNYYK